MATIPKSLRGQKWKTLRRVKMFTPHKLTFKNGQTVRVDDSELEKIKSEMQRIAENDQLATISEDHILTVGEDGKVRSKASKDINLLGFSHNWDIVRPRGRDPWLVADVLVDPEKINTAMGLPFVSVEYHPDQHRISNIAFTKLKPQLDTGVLSPYHWQRGEIEHDGQAAGRMAAYSIEGLTNSVVVYSSERMTMPSELETVLDKIDSGFNRLADALAGKVTPAPVVPAATVVPVVAAAPAALSYGALASGGATVGTVSDAEKELRQLKREKKLKDLAVSKKVNVEVELAEWANYPDDVFNKHCDSITACYASVNAGGATVTPLDSPGNGRPSAERIKQVQINAINRGETLNYESVAARLLTDPTWDGTK